VQVKKKDDDDDDEEEEESFRGCLVVVVLLFQRLQRSCRPASLPTAALPSQHPDQGVIRIPYPVITVSILRYKAPCPHAPFPILQAMVLPALEAMGALRYL
jgi:hypothetical protein